jgi:hypothetical protein
MLAPPGAPAATMKTLQQIEPRIDVQTLSGDSTNQFIISQSGSYYLTANIVGVTGKNAISIQADHVTIDLNGFALTNFASSPGTGILVLSAHRNLEIRNGIVRGWSKGVDTSLAIDTLVERIYASDNQSDGIKVGFNSTLTDCASFSNGGNGFTLATGCVISRCTATFNSHGINNPGGPGVVSECFVSQNSLNGIYVNGGSIRDCVALDNTGSGIVSTSRCSVHDCQSDGNMQNGFFLFDASTVTNCEAGFNGSTGIVTQGQSKVTGCTAKMNTVNGISTGVDCVVSDCSAALNSASGIVVTDNCRVAGCTANSNGAGTTGFGISAGNGATIEHCVAGSNKAGGISTGLAAKVDSCNVYKNSGTSGNSAFGISVSDSSLVSNNDLRENDSDAIRISAGCQAINNTCDFNGRLVAGASNILVTGAQNRIEGNNVTSNINSGFGIKVTSGGNTIFKNSAKTNTTNYNFAVGNDAGPTGTAALATSPWANIAY